MRSFRLLPALSLLFGACAFALEPRDPAPRPLDAQDLINVCACINAELVVPNSTEIQTPVGVLAVLLEVAILAVTTAGELTVSKMLMDLIDGATTKSCCVFPPHSEPNCAEDNLCGFECVNGFVPYPYPPVNSKVCKCPPGNVVGGRRALECIDTAHCPWESCDNCTLPINFPPSVQAQAQAQKQKDAVTGADLYEDGFSILKYPLEFDRDATKPATYVYAP